MFITLAASLLFAGMIVLLVDAFVYDLGLNVRKRAGRLVPAVEPMGRGSWLVLPAVAIDFKGRELYIGWLTTALVWDLR